MANVKQRLCPQTGSLLEIFVPALTQALSQAPLGVLRGDQPAGESPLIVSQGLPGVLFMVPLPSRSAVVEHCLDFGRQLNFDVEKKQWSLEVK